MCELRGGVSALNVRVCLSVSMHLLIACCMLHFTCSIVSKKKRLKKFQVRFVVLHRLRLSPWAYATLLLANHAASSLRLWFSFSSVFVDFRFLMATLNGHSRDFVVPQLLTHHRYILVHVQVLVLPIWIFVVFRGYPSLHQVL